MEYVFDFDPEKNAILKEDRGIGFEDVITLMESGEIVSVIAHPNQQRYPHQYICEVDIKGYIYIVPFVITGYRIFLKTIYPSRKATKKHRRKSYYGEEN